MCMIFISIQLLIQLYQVNIISAIKSHLTQETRNRKPNSQDFINTLF